MTENGRRMACLVVAAAVFFGFLAFIGSAVYVVCRRWAVLVTVLNILGFVLLGLAVLSMVLTVVSYFRVSARAGRLRRSRIPAVDRVGADGFLRFRVRI